LLVLGENNRRKKPLVLKNTLNFLSRYPKKGNE